MVESRRNLDTLQQNLSLALHLDILGPFNIASKITLGGNRISNTEVSWLGVEKIKIRVLLDLLVDFGNSFTSGFFTLLLGARFGGRLGSGLGSCCRSFGCSGLAATLRGRLLGGLEKEYQ